MKTGVFSVIRTRVKCEPINGRDDVGLFCMGYSPIFLGVGGGGVEFSEIYELLFNGRVQIRHSSS